MALPAITVDLSAMTVAAMADVSGTIRARAGLVVNNALAYVTGGAAWADVQQTGVEFNNVPHSPPLARRPGLRPTAAASSGAA